MGIADEICGSSAAVLGLNAVSYNMAVNALDILDSSVPYRGLGLADITVKAPVASENQELLRTLSRISAAHNLPICAMDDESAIFVRDSVVTHIGRIIFIGNGKIYPFSPELLNI